MSHFVPGTSVVYDGSDPHVYGVNEGDVGTIIGPSEYEDCVTVQFEPEPGLDYEQHVWVSSLTPAEDSLGGSAFAVGDRVLYYQDHPSVRARAGAVGTVVDSSYFFGCVVVSFPVGDSAVDEGSYYQHVPEDCLTLYQ